MEKENSGNGHITKRKLQSKKFVAYLVAEITWKALAVLVLFWGKDAIPTQVWVCLISIIVVAGFIEAGYILGQSSLDKYLRIAQIAVDAGHDISLKGIELTAPQKALPQTEPKPVLESKVPAPKTEKS